MGQRGRKSGAEMSVSPALTVLETRRPSPPADLTEAEAAIWRDTVGCLPAGWFTKAQHPLLRAYCQHSARSQMFAAQVNAFRPEWLAEEGGLERFNTLLKMAERESRAMSSLATRMRITQHAQRDPSTAGRAARDAVAGPRPWDRFRSDKAEIEAGEGSD
jgi:hypothetical protein